MKVESNILRCVHIFPRFKNSSLISEFRKNHDYLHQFIEPHITLVFPFFSDLTDNEIATDLIKLLSHINSFEIICNGFSKLKGNENCIVMNLFAGYDQIYKLHYLVHEGKLKPYQSKITIDGSFVPHMTIGRFKTEEEMKNIFTDLESENWEFKATVNSIFIERIGKNEESIITNEIFLKS